MTDLLYVTTDATGVEHTPEGPVTWLLPTQGPAGTTDAGRPLTLRTASALLDVLEHRVFRAEPVGDAAPGDGGTVTVPAATLVAPTPWNTTSATHFALDCAEHLLAGAGELSLPDGTPLTSLLADARALLEGTSADSAEHLGYLARVRALRRLRRARADLADLSFQLVDDAQKRDIDAYDDVAYATVLPVTDSLLAAIEALRHHVLPHRYEQVEGALHEGEEDSNLDRADAMPVPHAVPVPFGPMEADADATLAYEPAWTAARDAARHARLAAHNRDGDAGEAAELAWQADTLATLLGA